MLVNHGERVAAAVTYIIIAVVMTECDYSIALLCAATLVCADVKYISVFISCCNDCFPIYEIM